MKELLTLALTGVFAMLADMFDMRKLVFPLALFGLAMTISWSIFDWDLSQRIAGMMQADKFALAFTIVMCSSALLWLIMSEDYFDKLPVATDRYALVLFVLVGAYVMVSFTNLTMLFIGVEILSVALYVLAGSNKTDISSNESAFKYFLMGAFASGFLLFGIALLYGVSGTFNIDQIRYNLTNGPFANGNNLGLVGIIMILVGLGFKVSAAPFHFWAPDVYQGAPTPITAFMATVVKTAAIATMAKLFIAIFPMMSGVWMDILTGMIVLTLLIGNVVAVMQHDAKRMLAFSSISHVGYMLIAILSNDHDSYNSVLFYTAAYSVATIVGFMVLYLVSEASGSNSIASFNGLGKKNLPLAVAMTMSLMSMAGIPPLSGFMAKYFIFTNAIADGHLGLVLFAIAMSLVGVYYYFKIIIAMFFADDTEGVSVKPNSLQNVLLIIGCGLMLILGLFPQILSNAI